MAINNHCFSINSYDQAIEVLKICKKNKICPILHIKYFLINGFGIEWLISIQKLLKKKFSSNFKLYVDSKKNYGLFIHLVEIKVNYIKIEADKETMKKLKEIAKIEKVSVNPNFSILDLSKRKKIELKILMK